MTWLGGGCEEGKEEVFPLSISAEQISPKPSSLKNHYFIIITWDLKRNWDLLGVWGLEMLMSWPSDGAGSTSGVTHTGTGTMSVSPRGLSGLNFRATSLLTHGLQAATAHVLGKGHLDMAL